MSRSSNIVLPADPDVKIPAAIKRIAAHAEDIHKQNYKVEEAPAPVTSEGNPPVVVEKPVEPPPAPAVVEKPVELPPAPERTADEWKRDYNAMRGRFAAAESDRKSLSTRIAELETLIATLQPAHTSQAPAKLLTDDEVREYGAEFLDVVAKKTKETLGSEVETLKKEVNSLRSVVSKTASVQTVDAKEKMLAKLDRKVPNWRGINFDANFISWLGLPDVYSGGIRHELLKAAFAQCETDRVLAFFKGFLKEAASTPASGGNQAPAKTIESTPVPQVSLEELAAPGRAKAPAASIVPGEKPVVTRAQISQFYRDVNSGKFRGRDADKQAFENAIFEATREGRIR